MNSCVLDASVAAKWFLPSHGEPYAKESVELLRRYSSGLIELSVPDLFWPEMGNILWKAARASRISQESASDALKWLRQLTIATFDNQPLMSDALALAIAYDSTVYDALYVTLAVITNQPLVTADDRLAARLGTRFPVRSLGSLM